MKESPIVLREGNLRVRFCRHGWMAYPSLDTPIGLSLDQYGEYSEMELHLWNLFLQPNSIAWDVGAHIGSHTLFLSRRVGPAGRVIALEPQRLLHQNLQANLTLNQIENTVAFPVALGAETRQRRLPPLVTEFAFRSDALRVQEEEGDPVEQHTPESLGLPAPQFIKIDVEGAEPEVLRGAAAVLETERPVVYLDAHDRQTAPRIMEELDRRRYRCHWHPVPLFNPQNFQANPENLFPQLVQWHLIACPREREITLPFLVEAEPSTPWLADRMEAESSAGPTS